MMIIQNSTPPSQAALPVRRVSDDAPKVVSEAPNARATVAGESQNQNTDQAKTTVKQAGAQLSSAEQLQSAVNEINKAMRKSNQSLEFSVDNDTKKPMTKLVDSDTGELIRQIPSEETLAIARSIDRFQRGLLLKQQA